MRWLSGSSYVKIRAARPWNCCTSWSLSALNSACERSRRAPVMVWHASLVCASITCVRKPCRKMEGALWDLWRGAHLLLLQPTRGWDTPPLSPTARCVLSPRGPTASAPPPEAARVHWSRCGDDPWAAVLACKAVTGPWYAMLRHPLEVRPRRRLGRCAAVQKCLRGLQNRTEVCAAVPNVCACAHHSCVHRDAAHLFPHVVQPVHELRLRAFCARGARLRNACKPSERHDLAAVGVYLHSAVWGRA